MGPVVFLWDIRAMRIATFCFFLCLPVPGAAQEVTPLLGLSLTQDGAHVALTFEGEIPVAYLNAAPFELVFPEPLPDIVGVTFGTDTLFGPLDAPPETGLFGPGGGYAREAGPYAAYFMGDPLCADRDIGLGFNYLVPEHRVGSAYPVTAIEADAASRGCVAEGRWPREADLIGRVSPLYVVIRVGDVTERLVLHFVSG